MLAKSLIVFFGLCSLALSAPLVEEQRFNLNPRAGFCTSLFGINVCLDVSGVNGQLNLKLTVGGVTLFNQGIVASSSEYCGSAVGIKVCLKWSVNGNNACFSVVGTIPFLSPISANLGCVNLSDYIGK